LESVPDDLQESGITYCDVWVAVERRRVVIIESGMRRGVEHMVMKSIPLDKRSLKSALIGCGIV
jgi:hypothetical protein